MSKELIEQLADLYECLKNNDIGVARTITRSLIAKHEAYAQTQGQSNWISVDDRLPDDGQRVAWVADINKSSVHHYMHGEVFGGTFRMSDGHALFSYPGHSMYASFWMPLPAAPIESGVKG